MIRKTHNIIWKHNIQYLIHLSFLHIACYLLVGDGVRQAGGGRPGEVDGLVHQGEAEAEPRGCSRAGAWWSKVLQV